MIYDISGHDLYKGLIYTFITWKRTLDCLPLYTWQQVKSFTSKPRNWLFESQNTNLEDPRLNHNETVYETLVPTKVNRCFVLQEGCTCSYSYCIIMKITLNAFDSSAFLMQVKRGSISQNETMYTDIFIKEKKPSYLPEWQKDIPFKKINLLKKPTQILTVM